MGGALGDPDDPGQVGDAEHRPPAAERGQDGQASFERD
jgi:hypothetical protein